MAYQTEQVITAIIVDDEAHARQSLRMALGDYEQIEIIAECENGLQAVKAVHELKPMLIFLDIQMPKLDGFDVLELLAEKIPYVVFVTAYDDYALQAFEANAVDYVLKPIDPERLDKSVQRVVQRLSENHSRGMTAELGEQLRERRNEPNMDNAFLQRILVREKSDVHVLPVDSVCYIESADDYVAIQTETQTHIKLDRLNKLEQRLDPNQFCRIHRSILLNINYLAKIETETKDTKIAILKDGRQLAISRSGYASLRKLL